MNDFARIAEKTEEFDYVSFDVFDTLLIRPFVKPDDLFTYIEKNEKREGFAKARISAEKNARTEKCPEVTLDEIYGKIDGRFRDLTETEKEYEYRVLRPYPEIKKIYEKCIEAGKHVVLISDMYLPPDFVSSVLKKCGIDGYEKLYMSCEYRKSKHFGDLFETVIEDLGISPGQLLHIGDNVRSDEKTPAGMGIKTARCPKNIDVYFASHKRERKFYRKKKNYERSVLTGTAAVLRAEETEEHGYWHSIGYRYGGPLNAAFASFVEDSTEDGVLLFVARDGYEAKRVYDILYGSKKTYYVYATRLLNIMFDLNERDYPGYEKEITEYFSENPEVRALKGNPKEIFGNNRELFSKIMKEHLESYRSYIRKMTDGYDSVYVVDSTTQKFSSQRLIDAASGKKTKGVYYTLLKGKNRKGSVAFRNNYRAHFSLTAIDMPEFLMTSPERPIKGVDSEGSPIYRRTVSEHEIFREKNFGDVSEGTERYAEDLKKIFENKIPRLGGDTITEWLRTFYRNPDAEDEKHLSELYWASDPGHSEYHRMVFSPKDLPSVIYRKIRDPYRSLMNRIKTK
jgi:predicted HAD superfamily hydrolase